MARPQKFRHSREALTDPQIAAQLGGLVLDIEALRQTRKQVDDQIAAAYDAVDDGGFEKKFVRKVVSLRAKETDKRRDEEEGLEVYEFAIEKGVSLACARSKPDLPPHNPETGEITEPENQSVPSLGHASDNSAPLESASGAISSTNSKNDLCADDPITARQSRGPDPHELGAAIHEALKSEKLLHTNPLPSSSPSSEAISSPLTKTAGDVLPSLASPATNFNNPRCRKLGSCHFAHSRDCCHDCLLAFGQLPRDEQLRLWRDAERAARECEAA